MRYLWMRVRSAVRLILGWHGAAREDREAREEMNFHLNMQVEALEMRVASVSPGYFATAGIRLTAGREFTIGDSAKSERVAVLNRAAAEVLFPGENAVGQPLLHSLGDTMPARIVGIVDDARIDGPIAPVKPELFEPKQQSRWGEAPWFLVRTTRDPVGIFPTVRRVVKQLSPSAGIADARSLEELAERYSARQRFYGGVFGIFAVVGLVLASIGIYGLVAYSVVLRRREVAIRAVLGATTTIVLGQFLRDGLVTVGAGVVAGIAATIVSSRIVESLLFDVYRRTINRRSDSCAQSPFGGCARAGRERRPKCRPRRRPTNVSAWINASLAA